MDNWCTEGYVIPRWLQIADGKRSLCWLIFSFCSTSDPPSFSMRRLPSHPFRLSRPHGNHMLRYFIKGSYLATVCRVSSHWTFSISDHLFTWGLRGMIWEYDGLERQPYKYDSKELAGDFQRILREAAIYEYSAIRNIICMTRGYLASVQGTSLTLWGGWTLTFSKWLRWITLLCAIRSSHFFIKANMGNNGKWRRWKQN